MKIPFWIKLTGLFSAMILLGTMLSAWVSLRRQRSLTEHGYFRQAETIAGTLSPLFLEPLLRGRVSDPDQYRRTLAKIIEVNTDLKSIRVLLDDGSPLLPDLPASDTQSPNKRPLRLIRLVTLHPTPTQSLAIGSLELIFDAHRLDDITRDQIRESVRTAVLFILLGFAASLFISRLVTVPLGKLAAGMKRLREGDLSVAVAVESRDEIGDLAATFNETVMGLRAKKELLPYIPETLWRLAHQRAEGKVDELVVSRAITILFCDLRGFTAFSAERPPAEVVAFLNRFFGAASDAIRAEGGSVDKFIGDACLAIFDLPEENGAPAAVRAGLAISRFVTEDPEAVAGAIGVRIGINTGDAILGEVGSGDRRDFTVIGSEVNKAQRIESACEPGAVYVSGETAERLRAHGGFVLEHREPIAAKGFFEPIKVQRVRKTHSADS